MSNPSAIQFLINTAPIKMKYFKEVCQSIYGETNDYISLLEVLLEKDYNFIPKNKLLWILDQIDYDKPLNSVFEHALHLACKIGTDPEILKIILKKTKNLECRNEHGQTPMNYAVVYEQYDAFVALYDAGAQIKSFDDVGITVEQILKFSINHLQQRMHNYHIEALEKRKKDSEMHSKVKVSAPDKIPSLPKDVTPQVLIKSEKIKESLNKNKKSLKKVKTDQIPKKEVKKIKTEKEVRRLIKKNKVVKKKSKKVKK